MIALGDVSGKGTAAALLMSSLHAAIHAQSASHDSLVATISAVNRYLADNIPANRFCHAVLCGARSGVGSALVSECGSQSAADRSFGGTVEQLRREVCRSGSSATLSIARAGRSCSG